MTTPRLVNPQARTGRLVLSSDKELLPVRLTEEEARDRGRELAQRIEDRLTEVNGQKAARELAKQTLLDMDGEIARLSKTVRAGEEDRFVDVSAYLIAGNVVHIRTDTGGEVRSRPATDSERQMALFKGEPETATESTDGASA